MNLPAEGVGYLQVRVSTAQDAIPLKNAQVVIRTQEEPGGKIVSQAISDRSGLTPKIALPTVPRALSESPGNPHPFATYYIDVSKEGYYMQYYQNVPIFDGITSFQIVEMIPLPQNGFENGRSPDEERFFEGENPDL